MGRKGNPRERRARAGCGVGRGFDNLASLLLLSVLELTSEPRPKLLREADSGGDDNALHWLLLPRLPPPGIAPLSLHLLPLKSVGHVFHRRSAPEPRHSFNLALSASLPRQDPSSPRG